MVYNVDFEYIDLDFCLNDSIFWPLGLEPFLEEEVETNLFHCWTHIFDSPKMLVVLTFYELQKSLARIWIYSGYQFLILTIHHWKMWIQDWIELGLDVPTVL